MAAPVEMGEPRSKAAFFEAIAVFGAAFLIRRRLRSTGWRFPRQCRRAISDRRWKQADTASSRQSLRRFLEQGAARGWLGASDLDSALEAYFDLLIGSVTMGQLLRTEPLPDQDALRRRAERAAASLRRLAMSF
jgi:AefR-like transcriptional repressor, C-terminal domain